MAKAKQAGPEGLYTLPDQIKDPSRAMWGGLFIGFCGIVLSIAAGTEYAAWRLAFQRVLGKPLFWHIYSPIDGFVWAFKWGSGPVGTQARAIFTVAEFIWMLGSMAAVLAAGVYVYMKRRGMSGDIDLHGSAHFADDDEVEATGLVGQGSGVYVGAYVDSTGKTRYLRHDGPEHILAFAPTRCLDGDTGIVQYDGSALTIREMVERHERTGEQFDVLAYDVEKGRPERSRAHGAYRSGTKRCVRIELANGQHVVADREHLMFTLTGEWKPAKELRPGVMLMPYGEAVEEPIDLTDHATGRPSAVTLPRRLYRVDAKHLAGATVVSVVDAGARETFDLSCDPHENFALAAGSYAHNSGKGVGLVIPTLLSWPHSTVVHDIKGENYGLTAGWRSTPIAEGGAGNVCILFDPTESTIRDNGPSARFNPLQEIRLRTDSEVKDVQNIATMIVDPDGKGLNDHWAKTGFSLLVGTILHVLYSERDKTLRGVAGYLSDPAFSNVDQIFETMANAEHDPDSSDEELVAKGWIDGLGRPSRTHPVVAQSAKDMLNKSANEKSGVLSTAMSFLTLYRDPIVAKNTEVSDFKIDDLMNYERPVSLFLVVPPSDKDRLKPLIRLIINQVVRTLTERMKREGTQMVGDYLHRLLLMIDELPALGKLDILQESLAFVAGYGLKCYLITQDLSQLHAAYTRDESIVSNCHVRVAYAPNKIETADLLSKMAGISTVRNTNRSFSGSRFRPALSSINVSDSYSQRSLLTPDEVMSLPKDDALVFVAGHRPIYGRKIKYFEDATFLPRSRMLPPSRTGVTRKNGEAVVVSAATATAPSPMNPSADRDLTLGAARGRAQQHEVGR